MFTLVQEDDEAKQVKAEQVMRERWGGRWWTRAGGGICDWDQKLEAFKEFWPNAELLREEEVLLKE